MAAAERISGNVSFPVKHELWGRRIDCTDNKKQPHAQRKRPNQYDDFLDVELLCKKLEIAKREREERDAASRLRKQVREAVKQDSNAPAGSERPRTLKKTSTNDGSKRASWYKLPAAFRKSQPTLSVSIPEAENEHPFSLISPVLDQGLLDHEDRDLVLLSRPPTPPEEDADRKRQQMRAKRSSFTVLKHFTTYDREQLRRIGETINERPSSRRAQTVPFFKSKFMSSSQKLAPSDAEDSCRPSDVDDSFGGIVNEYTISFDTCQIHQNIKIEARQSEQLSAAPVQRPRLGSKEGISSLLNLGTILRKEKKTPQLRVEEIYEPEQGQEDDDPHTRRPHTRSQTAPEELISHATTRFKKEEEVRKRRTVGNLLQSLIAPNYSMSMHQVAL